MNLIKSLNIENIKLTVDGFEASMKLSDFHAQPLGYVNGGAILAFAEISAGKASNLLEKGEKFAVGQAVSANHLKSHQSKGFLYANAKLLHKGIRSHVWCIQIIDESNKLISQVTVQNAIITLKK